MSLNHSQSIHQGALGSSARLQPRMKHGCFALFRVSAFLLIYVSKKGVVYSQLQTQSLPVGQALNAPLDKAQVGGI